MVSADENKIKTEDITKINKDTLFLSFIESKECSDLQIETYINEKLSHDKLKKIMEETEAEMSDKEEIELELMMQGEYNFIKEIKKDIFELLKFIKENRTSPLFPEIAVLTCINDQIYNFNTLSFIKEENYYINCAIPFSQILEDDDWNIIYNINEKTMKIAFNVDKETLFKLFYDQYSKIIDEKASSKIYVKRRVTWK